MTKNVLVTISGLHYDDSVMMVQEENSNEANSIEVTTPATYYLKNGKHYIVYDEIVEGIPGTIKNRIKIDEGKLLDITKSGITNSHMVFETDKINVTPYQTPYGDLLLGTYTFAFFTLINTCGFSNLIRFVPLNTIFFNFLF